MKVGGKEAHLRSGGFHVYRSVKKDVHSQRATIYINTTCNNLALSTTLIIGTMPC